MKGEDFQYSPKAIIFLHSNETDKYVSNKGDLIFMQYFLQSP